jgi:2-polyprenyl-6-hydroxyphenyl methylase/3-demethylubiquinone-9 3-methyltransferase
MSLFRYFVSINVKISKWFDRAIMPVSYTKDGNKDFIVELAPAYIKPKTKIFDVGGGKQPFVNVKNKIELELYVVGVDISQSELDRAPLSAYSETICGDISGISGVGDGDLVICQAVLEHVQDTEGAMRSISTLLKPGGKALIFVPSRNAVFARLNLLLPEEIKRKILYGVFPVARTAQGFPSFYHRCTPNDILTLAKKNGMSEVESRYYYTSNYFSFLFPLYFVWRIWVVLFRVLYGRQAAETFSVVLIKD